MLTDIVENVLTFPDTHRNSGGSIRASVPASSPGVAAWVRVEAGVVFPSNTTGMRNSPTDHGSVGRASVRAPAPTSGGLPMSTSATFYVAAGGTVEARATQNSGGSSTTTADTRNFIAVTYLGA